MEKDIALDNNTPKERGERLKAEVTALMQWKDGDYAKLQYEYGLRYLKSYLDNDDHFEDLLSRSKIFWNWWKNHWANRDEQFIELHNRIHLRNIEIRRQMYQQYNEPRMLAACIHPNSVVLNETYCDMTKELIKEEVAR